VNSVDLDYVSTQQRSGGMKKAHIITSSSLPPRALETGSDLSHFNPHSFYRTPSPPFHRSFTLEEYDTPFLALIDK
jgi:hypothetical protein